MGLDSPRPLTDDHYIAEWDAFIVVIWRHLTTAEGVASVGKALARAADAGRRISVVISIEPSATPPAAAERKALSSVFTRYAQVVVAVAVVPQGTGFRASMVRGVVTGLALVSRFPYPYKVFGDLDEATKWLVRQAVVGPAKAALLSNAVSQLRRQLDGPVGALASSK